MAGSEASVLRPSFYSPLIPDRKIYSTKLN